MFKIFQEGRAALHLAAEKDHLDVVDLLLQHKAFVNAKNKAGVTPAHLAAERGAADIVELLVEKYKASTDVLSLVKLIIEFPGHLVFSGTLFFSRKRHLFIWLPKPVSGVFASDFCGSVQILGRKIR